MYILNDYDAGLKNIIENGVRKPNRTGIDTLSLFGLQGRYKIDNNFPLPTKRKYAYKSIFAELLWMISGSTDVNELEKMGSKIWTAWRDPEFEKKNGYSDGELGPIYGWQFRHFGGFYLYRNSNINNGFDQIKFIIEELKSNKFSRRILINLWNPIDMTSTMVKLPCCHYSFQLLVDNNDNLTGILSQRSGDWLPGVSANIFFYSAFLYMIAQQTGLKPYELIHNVADAHVYVDQIDAAKEYLDREEVSSPKLILNKAEDIFSYKLEDFKIIDYNPLSKIIVPVAV